MGGLKVRCSTRIKQRPQAGVAGLSEFPLTIYVLFLIVLLPLINLASLFVAASVEYLATNDFVAKAATQANYSGSLNTMVSEAYQFCGNGLAKFVSLNPDGGFAGCGSDLYVLVTDIASGAVKSSPANLGLPFAQPINTKTNIYELQIKSVYRVSPLISLAAVPILQDVPGLGKPVTLTFAASRTVEHPDGLQMTPTSASPGSVTPFARVASIGVNTAQAGTNTWRNPTIYEQIQAAGETIVSENVFIVQANNSNWTSSGLNVQPGQKVWVDTQALGVWGPDGTTFKYDANGGPTSEWSPYYFNVPLQVLNLPMASLVGKVGATGTPFLVGNDQYNYPCSGSGNLSMIFNDYLTLYKNSTGLQLVRVIVVQ